MQNHCAEGKLYDMGGREELSENSDKFTDDGRPSSTENECDNSVEASEYFRVKINESASEATAANHKKAVSAFVNFLGNEKVSFDSFTEPTLTDWAIWLIESGYTLTTAIHYLKYLSALYGKAVADGAACANPAFSNVLQHLRRLPAKEQRTSDRRILKKVQAMIRAAESADRSTLANDVAVFAILAGGLSPEQIARYRKDDYTGDNPVLKAIIARHSRPRNKYLFPLRQSERTPRQMSESLHGISASAFGTTDAPSAADIWSMAAYDCGIPAPEILACTGEAPAHNPVYALVHPAQLDAAAKERILARVAEALTSNPVQWHAMQFRPGVSYDSVMHRIAMAANEFTLAETYYPCSEIARRTGKKLVCRTRPVIPGLLFFKMRRSDVPVMFLHIGDLAWGYHTTGARTSPYAVISQTEIDILQQTIGIFTPDTEVYPAGTIPLAANDKVVVIGGDFIGKPGILDSLKKDSDGAIVCRLRLPGGNSIEWLVDSDPRMVRKISDSKFDELVDELSS